jgi:Fe-S cluster biogenesis protein NfuA
MKTNEEIQQMLDGDINKAIAAHSGKITVISRGPDTKFLFVEMRGGCQGCAGARYTLNSIVSQAIKEFDPTVETVVDSTDHSAGQNPFYKKDPSNGMP